MDRDRFDALTRAFAAKRSRRGAVGAIASVALLAHRQAAQADPGKGKGKGHDKENGQGHVKGKGQGHQFDKLCGDLSCEKTPVPVDADREFCCKGGFCSCGGDCCDEQSCFQTGTQESPEKVFCCTGPKLVICLVPTGVPGELRETCCEGSCEGCGEPGTSGIAGSYRRPNR